MTEIKAHEAAYKGELAALKEVVTDYYTANQRDAAGNCPLHYLAQGEGDAECLQHLLACGAEVNIVNCKGYSPLHNAAFSGNYHCAEVLVAHGADVNLLDRTHSSPLHYACLLGDLILAHQQQQKQKEKQKQKQDEEEREKEKSAKETASAASSQEKEKAQSEAALGKGGLVRLLLENGARANIRCEGGATPLHYAAVSGNAEACEYLIRCGANVNATDYERTTPLHRAAGKSSECCRILLENGANSQLIDVDESTALHHAGESGDGATVALLLEKGKIPIHAKNCEAATPLHVAAFHGNVSALKSLLEHGASFLETDSKGTTPLMNATWNGHLSCVEALLETLAQGEAKSYCNIQDLSGASALHKACYRGHPKLVEYLCSKQAKLGLKDKEGALPMHKAAYNGHIDCIEVLLRYLKEASSSASSSSKNKSKTESADNGINCRDGHGSTPLHKAALRGQIKCVEFLLSNGADWKLRDKQGGTALHNAVQSGDLECVQLFVKDMPTVEWRKEKKDLEEEQKEAKQPPPTEIPNDGVNVVDEGYYSPLHVAACIGSADIAVALLDHGAVVDRKNAHGRTPLYYAVRGGHEDIARLLIVNGWADVNVQDDTGRFIIDLHMYYGRSLTPELLLALVHEREHPVAERLDIEALTPEQRKILTEGITLFNQKPKKGIEHLVKEKLIADTPSSLAHFLFTTPNLDPTQVGEYMSDGDEKNASILAAYCELYDFHGLPFVTAIRRFLSSSFMLPGEAQKIDRVMEAFAKRYYQTNPSSCFRNADAAFVLAFATIMLNTDAHSEAVKNKMTCEQFINSLKGINDGTDLEKDFVIQIYRNVVDDEIRMKNDDVPWANAEHYSWMMKQGGRRKNWRSRWVVLKDNCLFYFKKKGDKEPVGMIPLEDLAVTKKFGKRKHRYCICLRHNDPRKRVKSCRFDAGKKGASSRQGNHEFLLLAVQTKEELEAWYNVIQKNVQRNPSSFLAASPPYSKHETPPKIDKKIEKTNSNQNLSSNSLSSSGSPSSIAGDEKKNQPSVNRMRKRTANGSIGRKKGGQAAELIASQGEGEGQMSSQLPGAPPSKNMSVKRPSVVSNPTMPTPQKRPSMEATRRSTLKGASLHGDSPDPPKVSTPETLRLSAGTGSPLTRTKSGNFTDTDKSHAVGSDGSRHASDADLGALSNEAAKFVAGQRKAFKGGSMIGSRGTIHGDRPPIIPSPLSTSPSHSSLGSHEFLGGSVPEDSPRDDSEGARSRIRVGTREIRPVARAGKAIPKGSQSLRGHAVKSPLSGSREWDGSSGSPPNEQLDAVAAAASLSREASWRNIAAELKSSQEGK